MSITSLIFENVIRVLFPNFTGLTIADFSIGSESLLNINYIKAGLKTHFFSIFLTTQNFSKVHIPPSSVVITDYIS